MRTYDITVTIYKFGKVIIKSLKLIRVYSIGVGAQSTLRGEDIFVRKYICMKN